METDINGVVRPAMAAGPSHQNNLSEKTVCIYCRVAPDTELSGYPAE